MFFDYDGIIHSHFFNCNESGEQFTSTELDELNLIQVYNQYRDKHNLPFPTEIKEIRKQYGLSASKMAEILGFGTNSYRNYENGEVPSNSNGRLIQIVSDPRKFRDVVDLCDTLALDEKSNLMAKINEILAKYDLNITGQYLSTDPKVGYVITDLDKEYNKEVLEKLRNVEGTIKFRVLY